MYGRSKRKMVEYKVDKHNPQEQDEMEKYSTFEIMAYNMRVIRALWKSIKGNYGENIVRDNKDYTNSLYASIEKSRESIRQIEYNELTTENMKIIDTWAKRVDKKTGIPFEYLEGRERIKLGKEFEETYFPQYADYAEACHEINELLKRANKNPISYSSAKIKKIVEGKGYTPKERAEFDHMIESARKALRLIREFEDALYEEAERIKRLDTGQLLETDKKLYKLVYYISKGKQSEAINTVTREDLLRIMERTKMEDLKKFGSKELKRYIDALERQLILARAVYIESNEP